MLNAIAICILHSAEWQWVKRCCHFAEGGKMVTLFPGIRNVNTFLGYAISRNAESKKLILGMEENQLQTER